MKTHLTPMDIMRLNAARDDSGNLPTVQAYNDSILFPKPKQTPYCGIPIEPIGGVVCKLAKGENFE